jgi:hypothetical protein
VDWIGGLVLVWVGMWRHPKVMPIPFLVYTGVVYLFGIVVYLQNSITVSGHHETNAKFNNQPPD